MVKGKKKAKAPNPKRGRAGDARSATVPNKHDKTAERVAATAVAKQTEQTPTQQGAVGSKVVGFINLGNTCFFNSVLQVLVASPPLQQFFFQPDKQLQQGPLGGALQEVFEQLQNDPDVPPTTNKATSDKLSKAKKQKPKGAYAPQRLLSAVCKVAPHFKGFQQQDSHELLRVLLDGLQTEEAKAITAKLKRGLPQQDEDEEAKGNRQTSSGATPQGFLSEVFGGELSSRVACGACGHTSVTLEPFMDLSLPIPSASLLDLDASASDRRPKKMMKGKKAKAGRGDDSSAATSDAVQDEAQHSDKKLSPKQKRKLMKEERKAVKLERKKQPKEAAASATTEQAHSSSDAAASSSTSSAQPAAQAGQTDAAASDAAQAEPSEPAQDNEAQAGGKTQAGAQPQAQQSESSEPARSVSVHTEDASRSETGLQAMHNHAAQPEGQEHWPGHQQGSVSSPDTAHAEPAEPAEPHDVLHEFEQLSHKLPDMPKHDMKDDLAGLFKAAFATCHAEMSPRGAAPESTFGTHGQDREEEDYSLYEDADEAMEAGEPRQVALDASDEEQEDKRGEMAGPLLDGFIGDAVTNTLHTDTSQEVADDDSCTNIGSLFDESAVEDASAPAAHSGAAEEADTPERGTQASGGATLQSCLQEFFQQEHITWECPKERQAKKELRRSSLGPDKELPSTPVTGRGPEEGSEDHAARRTVSFSEAKPVVTLIPGSVEQRGQVFRTSHGDPPFCRPLRLGGAFVLLTTAPDQRRPTRMQIKIQPQDEEEATLLLASNVRHLATADVPAPKVGDDEDEVRLAQAQVLMDCLADLLSQKGLDGTRAWCEGGLKLRCNTSDEGNTTWIVVGQLPEEEGQGRWEYPSPVDPSQPPSDGEVDFVPAEVTRGSSDSSDSASSSAAGRRDSSDFMTLMGALGGVHDSQTDMSGEASSDRYASPQESKDSRSSCPDGTVVPEADDAGATAGAESDDTGLTAADRAERGTPDPSVATGDHGTDSQATPQDSDQDSAQLEAGVHPHPATGSAVLNSADDTASPAACSDGASSATDAASPDGTAEQLNSQDSNSTTPHQAVSEPETSGKDDNTNSDFPKASSNSESHQSTEALPNGEELPPASAELSSSIAESATNSSQAPPKSPKGGSPKKGGLVNVQRPAVKGYSIHRCPPLLTVHVKRFQQDMRGRLSKIDGAVPFPLNMDLTPFCDPKGANGIAQYTLLGFVEHMGTMRSGHYVAYVQRGLSVSDSPHLQSLMHKHDIGAVPMPASSDDATPAASGKGKGKASAAKAGIAGKGKSFPSKQANGQVTTRTPAKPAEPAASNQSLNKAQDSVVDPPPAADHLSQHDSSAPTSDALQKGNGFEHTNGTAQPQQNVPEDWESSAGSSSDEADMQTSSILDHPANASVQAENEEVEQATEAVEQVSSSDVTTSSEQVTANQHQKTAQLQRAEGSHKSAAKKLSNSQEDIKQQEKRVWYYVSDTQVKPVTEADVMCREAYILLYMRTL